MKYSFAAIVLTLGLASCSTLSQTSKSLDVETTASSLNRADLIVSPTKTSYTMEVNSSDRRLGEKGVLQKAVAQALKNAGNGDVMVAPQYEIHKIGLRHKITQVTVTGYSATYRNFRAVDK